MDKTETIGSVLRVEKSSNFTSVDNGYIFNKNLSTKAVGFLTKVLALPPNWKYNFNGLVSLCQEGETAIRNIMKELQNNGYLKVNKLNNKKGKFIYEYLFIENPQKIKSRVPDITQPDVDNIDVDEPHVDNVPLLNTNISNTECRENEFSEKKEEEYPTLEELISDFGTKNKKTKVFTKPTAEELKNYAQEIEFGELYYEPEKFIDYYDSVGWMVGGKTKMKDWKAAVRTWKRNHQGNTSSQPIPEKKENTYGIFYEWYAGLPDDDKDIWDRLNHQEELRKLGKDEGNWEVKDLDEIIRRNKQEKK